MKQLNIRHKILNLLTTLLLSIFILNVCQAEDIPLFDGNLWLKSTTDNKHSYLIGISNLLSVEYGFQKASKQPPTAEQSIIPRLFEDVEEISLDAITKRIDTWYEKHPEKLNHAVINVIWVELVKPK